MGYAQAPCPRRWRFGLWLYGPRRLPRPDGRPRPPGPHTDGRRLLLDRERRVGVRRLRDGREHCRRRAAPGATTSALVVRALLAVGGGAGRRLRRDLRNWAAESLANSFIGGQCASDTVAPSTGGRYAEVQEPNQIPERYA